MLDQLISVLPPHLYAHAVMSAYEDDWFDDSLLMHRFIRCLIADRIQEHTRSPRASAHHADSAAKRTVLHAMALVAAWRRGLPIDQMAPRWDYPRPHLYRAAKKVAQELGCEWNQIDGPLRAEGLWPYDSGAVVEVVGEHSFRFISALPLPVHGTQAPRMTSVFPLKTKLPRTVQITVGSKPSRPEAICLEVEEGSYYLHGREVYPLEVLQIAHERAEMAHGRYEESICRSDQKAL